MMEDQMNSMEALFEKTSDFVETRIQLAKLQAVSKLTDVASSMLSRVVVALIIILMVIILNTGIAIWLGEIFGKMYYGFFCVAGFYLLLIIILSANRGKWLKKPISDRLINKLLK